MQSIRFSTKCCRLRQFLTLYFYECSTTAADMHASAHYFKNAHLIFFIKQYRSTEFELNSLYYRLNLFAFPDELKISNIPIPQRACLKMFFKEIIKMGYFRKSQGIDYFGNIQRTVFQLNL